MQTISILLHVFSPGIGFFLFKSSPSTVCSPQNDPTNTHMQSVTEQPQQVVCMWVVWVLNIHPGWHLLQAKMLYGSWLPTSCGSGLLPHTGNNKRKRKVVQSPHEFHSVLIICAYLTKNTKFPLSGNVVLFFHFASYVRILCRNESLNCRAPFLCYFFFLGLK